jgi:hypothetical protein
VPRKGKEKDQNFSIKSGVNILFRVGPRLITSYDYVFKDIYKIQEG